MKAFHAMRQFRKHNAKDRKLQVLRYYSVAHFLQMPRISKVLLRARKSMA